MALFGFRRVRLGFALCGVALVAGCAAAAKNEPYFGKVTPPEGQVLRYISGPEPQTLDPQVMTGLPESRIAAAIFDGLVEYDEKTNLPRPSLAINWDINHDGTVWTFHLRRDAKWTDGHALNARDFVYSWRRALAPNLAASNAYFLYPVKNAQAYNQLSAFVRDPQTGKYATLDDLTRASVNGVVNFTGAEPENFDAMASADATSNASTASRTIDDPSSPVSHNVKYLFVPADAQARNKLLTGDATKKISGNATALARFVVGKQFVPVKKENLGLRALDDDTFQVTLESPSAYFIKMLTHQFFRPVPRQAIEKWGDALWVKPEHIVTSGAFKVEAWRPYEEIVVVKNPMFWNYRNVKLDKIIFPSIEQLTTAMNLYKAGEVDATQTNEVPPPWTKQLKETKRDYIYGPFLQTQFAAIKTTMPPLTDIRVRRALSLAINRQILADQQPGRLPWTGFVPPIEGYENYKGEDYNPDEARRLLAEAGFPNGRGFPQIEVVYNTSESNKQTYEIVQAMLKKELNIKLELTNQEFRVYLESTRNRMNFKGLARRGWIGDYVDPNSFLDVMTSASDNNGTGFADPKYDQMLRAANAEIDDAKRMKMLSEAESYMMKQQPIIPLYVGTSSFMRKPYVKNLLPNLLDQHDWDNVYIDHNWREEDDSDGGSSNGEANGKQTSSLLDISDFASFASLTPVYSFFNQR